MKTKLLLALLLTSSAIFSQIPTDETMRYLFTNGSLVNEANPGTGNLVQTGSASTQISDVNSVANAALELNGDSFVGGQTASTNNREITISFWMKSLPPTNSTPQVILQLYGDGGRGIRLQQSLHGSGDVLLEWRGKATNNQAKGVLFNPNAIHDNQWHHIAIRTFEFYASSDQAIPVEIYIDGVQNTNFNVGFNDASAYFPPFLSNGVLTIAPSGNYQGGIDDVRVYERSLSSTEINQLSKDNNLEIIYVDKNATGSNDGTSWANAYTDLQNAISNITSTTDQVWIAKGEYTPHASDRNSYFDFNVPNVTVYGSFDGESSPDNRDLKNNRTILSGELTNDGNVNNNSYHIVRVTAGNIILDGLTIEQGNANASSGFNSQGSAIYKNANIRDITIRNCVIRNNRAKIGAVNLAYGSGLTGSNLKIEKTRFHGNVSDYGSGLYYNLNVNASLNTEITNCLFDGNESTSYSSSAAWLRATNAGTYNDVKITNCTFTKNNNNGNSYTNTSMRAVLGLSGINTRMPVTVSNTIFYDNIDQFHGTNGVAQAISGISSNLNASVTVYNSIDELSFSNISNLNNTLNSDPLFQDTSNSSYVLLPGSPALDSGNNSFVKSNSKDLAGNNRIFNGIVDMGCYEVQSTNTVTLTINNPVGDGTTNPIANTYTYFEGSDVTVSAEADNGWFLDSWTGDASGNLNPLVVTMNTNKVITANFSLLPPVYVDKDATGNNDGTSWADAFTTIAPALTAGSLQIWIADGTYRPTATLNISPDNLKVYGGFNGTETALSERDIQNNVTIISGDINGDDTGVGYDSAAFNRTDNLYHIVWLNGNNTELNGITFQDGNANTIGTHSSGSVIYKNNSVSDMTIKNCVFKDNVNYNAGSISGIFGGNSSLNIENTRFTNNIARYGAGIYCYTSNNGTLNVNIVNSLFNNNRLEDRGSDLAFSSVMWLRANGTNSTINVNIVNSTFANNVDNGTANFTERSTVGLSEDGSGRTLNATISNTIFYGNVSGANTSYAVGSHHTDTPSQQLVYNSIDEEGFSNLVAGDLTNTSNANPLFTDANNNDFTLQVGSPAIDSGDNTKVPAGITTDLLFNQRIHNTTVDMGCYEFGAASTLSNQEFEVENNQLVVYPNPATSVLNIQSNYSISKVEVYDLLGKKVLETQETTIDISGLKSGVYLLKTQSESNTIIKRFIKR